VLIFQDSRDSTLFVSEMVVEYRHAIAARIGHRPRFEFRIGRNGVRAESGRNVFVQDAGIAVHGDQARFEVRVYDERHALRLLARFPFHYAFVRLGFGVYCLLIYVFRTIWKMVCEIPRRHKRMNAVRAYMHYFSYFDLRNIKALIPSVMKIVVRFQRQE
jgi:hypothetical protein